MKTKIVECGWPSLHTEHSWQGGFLFLTKKVCRGSSFPSSPSDLPEDFVPPSAALVPLTIFEHKHDFKLADGIKFASGKILRKREVDLLWVCDWLDCEHVYVTERAFWNKQGAPYNGY